MQTGTKKWLIRGGSFAIAGLLLFLALRGVDLRQVGTALVHANYWWVIPIVAITLLIAVGAAAVLAVMNGTERRARLEAPRALGHPPAQGRARPTANPHRRAEHDDHVEGVAVVAVPAHPVPPVTRLCSRDGCQFSPWRGPGPGRFPPS